MKKWIIFLIAFVSLGLDYIQSAPVTDVDIGVYIHDIGLIDALHQSVEIEGTLLLRWQDKAEATSAAASYHDSAAVEMIHKIWFPYTYIKNGRGARQPIHKVLYSDGKGTWTYQERFKTMVETPLDVHLFPFDQQKIHLTMVPFGVQSTPVNFKVNAGWEGIYPNQLLSEWDVKGYTSRVEQTKIHPEGKEDTYTLSVDYARKPGFYVYKIILPMLMLVVLAMVTLMMRGDPISSRSQIALACILSIIALELLVYQSIPKVSYAIYIDALFLICFLTACVVMLRVVIFNSFLFLRKRRTLRMIIDIILPIAFIAALLIATLLFFG